MINRYIFYRVAFKLKNRIIAKPNAAIAIGTSSLVNSRHNLHSVFIDYDGKNKEEVVADVNKLINRFHLRNASLFKTCNGFHAIFFYDVREWDEVKKIIRASKADWRYKSFCDEYGRVFLRIAGKHKQFDIRYFGTIVSPYKATKDETLIGNGLKKTHTDLFKIHDEIDFKGRLYS
jgi:hypothetical protein